MTEFMQLADPQFGMFRSLSQRSSARRQAVWDRFRRVNLVGDEDPQVPEGVTDMSPESERLGAALAVANQCCPDFVMICGDLVNNPDDDEQAAAFEASIGRLDPDITLHCVPGNHDLSADFKRPVSDGLSAYRARFGADYYSFNAGETLFLALNSETIYDDREVPGECARQLAFVADTLAGSGRGGQVVVFMHRPLFVRHPRDVPAHVTLPPGRVALTELLVASAKPVTVFSGHLHQNRYVRTAQIEQVISGPVGFPLRGESGWRQGRASEARIEHAYQTFAAGEHPADSSSSARERGSPP